MAESNSSSEQNETRVASRRVLVADSNHSRGRFVSRACQEMGFSCVRATHGASALELALAGPPLLVITEIDLPLVDGIKLAEILRANPRTRSVRFLFLGPDEDRQHRLDAADIAIPASAPREEIIALVRDLMAKRERIDALERATVAGDRVDGDLGQLPFSDLLQVVHLGRKSGRIDLEREGSDVSLLDSGSPGDVERGIVLVRDGEILHAEGAGVEGEKALFRLLAWRHGRFTFASGQRPSISPRIVAPVRALLSEGLRQIAEWDRLALQLPSLDSQVMLRVKASELPNIVHPLTQEVMMLLEHYRDVREIVNHCSFPDYHVLRTLHTLIERGIVQQASTRVTGLGPSLPRESLFEEGQLRRLRNHLQAQAPRGARPVVGKILVAASKATMMPDMLNLLRRVPSIEISPAYQQNIGGAGELGTIGRIRLDDDLQIDLIQVPIDESHSPLWRMAGHGALGALLLLASPVPEATICVDEISRVLREQPRARVLHVVLLGRKDRISPEVLRENLSLIDESSLFLLPIESQKDPATLLRSLFARVIP